MAQRPMKSAAKPATDSSAPILEMRIPARAEWVRVVRLATAGVAGRAGFAYDDIEDIKLAVAEACNNAILHSSGASGAPEGEPGSTPDAGESIVTIRWQVLETGIRISVADEGRLPPPGLARRAGSTPDVARAVDDLPEGGMGLLLIESLMDEVTHETGAHADTTLHMTKHLPAATIASQVLKPAPAAAREQASQETSRPAIANPDPDAPVALGAPRPPR